MKKKRIFQERPQAEKGKSFALSLLIGCVGFFVCGISLLAIACFPVLMTEDPTRAAPVPAVIALLISAFVSGNLCARTYGKKGVICGASCGGVVILLLMIGSFLLDLTIHPMLFGICTPLILLTFSVAGISGSRRERKSRPKHRIKF